jgi:DNA sulfur modification protein DndE
VKECTFDTGDDGICIKSGKDGEGRRIGMPTEDVLVEDCTVYHAHGGFVIGSEMSGGVRNILVRNCTFIGTSIGIRFKSKRGRGGVVENIKIEGVRMEDIAEAAIDFNMYYGGKDPSEKGGQSEDSKIPQSSKDAPTFRDIRIRDLLCRGAGEAILIQGLPENPIHDITLKNVSINSEKGVTVKNAADVLFENVRVDSKIGALLTTEKVSNCSLQLQ